MIIVKRNELRNKRRVFNAVLIALSVVLSLGGSARSYAASEESELRLRSVSGEIAYVNEKRGELRLEGEESKKRRYPTEFRLNPEATVVTDPKDAKFLEIKDLKVGQHVTVEFNWIQGDWREPTIASKIIAFPMPEIVLQEITGEVEAIDGFNGTLIVEERAPFKEGGRANLVYFVFDPRYVVVMRSPSTDPVRLVLNPGDVVKVEYWVGDGARHAKTITLISAAPVIKSTTTTTTTKTTITR